MLRLARIFLAENKPAILSSMHHNAAGIYYEQETPIVLVEWRNSESLAKNVRSALESFSFREGNIRDVKMTEWPAYIASKCQSVSDFERTYHCIEVRPVNEAELFYDAFVELPGECAITLHTSLNRYGSDEEMGTRLLRLSSVCGNWDRML